MTLKHFVKKLKKITVLAGLVTFINVQTIAAQNYTTATQQDSDGDGLVDQNEQASEVLSWNFSARDALMFATIAYRPDSVVKAAFDQYSPFFDPSETFNATRMIKKELAPYWKVTQTYHHSNGFDAVLFESEVPNQSEKTHVLAIRGTDGLKDIDDDGALFVGANPMQGKYVEQVIDQLSKQPDIKKLYVTGHSLGGYLTLRAHAYAVVKGYSFVKKSYTFNAPKVKGNAFNRYLNDLAQIINQLTASKLGIHFKTDNDDIIPLVGFVNGAISVGKTDGKHAISSFYETAMANYGYFAFGTRQDITGKDQSLHHAISQTLQSSAAKQTTAKRRLPIRK